MVKTDNNIRIKRSSINNIHDTSLLNRNNLSRLGSPLSFTPMQQSLEIPKTEVKKEDNTDDLYFKYHNSTVGKPQTNNQAITFENNQNNLETEKNYQTT
jgi:hypothetical protein